MRAVISNIKKTSAFSTYNGLTFEVKEVLSTLCALQIPSSSHLNRFDTVDFTFDEVTIVDIDRELFNANLNYGYDSIIYKNIVQYCEKKGIALYYQTHKKLTGFAKKEAALLKIGFFVGDLTSEGIIHYYDKMVAEGKITNI